MKGRPGKKGEGTGILGGSFNPVHRGHLLAARQMARKMGLKTVLFIPLAASPFKKNGEMAPAKHRLAMLRLAKLMTDPNKVTTSPAITILFLS